MQHHELGKEALTFGGSFLILNGDPSHSIQALILSTVISIGTRIFFKVLDRVTDKIIEKRKNKKQRHDLHRESK